MGKIIVNLDVEMAKRKMSLSELAERVGLTLANLSILKTGKAKAVRFSTLDSLATSWNIEKNKPFINNIKPLIMITITCAATIICLGMLAASVCA